MDTYVRQCCEAVTLDTRTLGTNVPTISGDEWRARTVVARMGPLPPFQKGERTKQRRIHGFASKPWYHRYPKIAG